MRQDLVRIYCFATVSLGDRLKKIGLVVVVQFELRLVRAQNCYAGPVRKWLTLNNDMAPNDLALRYPHDLILPRPNHPPRNSRISASSAIVF